MQVARAFGHSCRQLEWGVTFYPPEPGYSNFNDIGYQRLVAWCGAAPNLIRLHAPCVKIDVETAAAIGRACPMLEEVKFRDLHCASPAETWARCFPKLRHRGLASPLFPLPSPLFLFLFPLVFLAFLCFLTLPLFPLLSPCFHLAFPLRSPSFRLLRCGRY